MSGGVDSSVAAGLLVEDGWDVIGVTLLLKPCADDGVVNWCCGADAQSQARNVASTLGIPFYAVDRAELFEQNVLEPTWAEYARGRTPNPCVRCNQSLKLGSLLELARKLGASHVATGHYARIEPAGPRGELHLLRGRDAHKDQSYFLYFATADQLASTLFPLGGLHKPEVRKIATRMNLATANRPDSQDACLGVAGGGFAEGLRQRFGVTVSAGNVVDTEGTVLAQHAGIHNFTIGQRKGLGVALGRRVYVVAIDAESHEVVVSDEPQRTTAAGLEASEVVLTGNSDAQLPPRCTAQIRYQHTPASAEITDLGSGRVEVRFDEPQHAVAPGQTVVFYEGPRVLGGGVIDRSL